MNQAPGGAAAPTHWYPQSGVMPGAAQSWSPGSTGYGNLSMSHSMMPPNMPGADASMAGTWHNHGADGGVDGAGAGRQSQPPQQELSPAELAALQLQELQNQMTTVQLDPYVFGSPGMPGFLEFIYPFCDWTFVLMVLMFLGSVVGLGVVLGDYKRDNIFKLFEVTNTAELEKAIAPFIQNINQSTCTHAMLFGSFGTVCLEGSLNANTFAVQMSLWNNARGALWCLAAFFTTVALIYALAIHVQRHPYGLQADIMSPEKQMELLRMTPAQQQMYFYQLRQTMMQQGPGCCGSSGIEVYDTPFYAFLRVAWGFSGITTFVWIATVLVSFYTFMDYYLEHTSGQLNKFWHDYTTKYISTLLVVGVYLTWPILCNLLELVVWLVGFLPWVGIRLCLKPGIERLRPSLPLSKLPGYIRADMFFMDFQDFKRLGFSRLQWMLLTESEKPFFDCCEDPTLIRDPDAVNAMVGGAFPLNMEMAMANAMKSDPNVTESKETVQEQDVEHGHSRRHRSSGGRRNEEEDVGEERSASRHRRRSRSKAQGSGGGESKSRRHRSGRRDPNDLAAGGEESKSRHKKHRNDRGGESVTAGGEGGYHRSRSAAQQDGAGDEGGSRRRRHSTSRRRSTAGGGGGSARRHRSRKDGDEKHELDALMDL